MRKVIIAVLFITVVFILEVRARQTPEPTLTPSALETTSTPVPTLPALEITPAPTPAPNEVWIQGGDYRPGTIIVPVGTKVTWTNVDYDAHDVDSDTGLFFCSLAFGVSFSYTFTERGTFNYSCGCNPGMAGTVIVE